MKRVPLAFFALLLLSALAPAKDEPALLDYSHAVILQASDATPLEQKAAAVLQEEISKRTHLILKTVHEWPATGGPVIALSTGLVGKAESYALVSAPGYLTICGHDSRGLLFGVGRLLREMRWHPERLQFPAGLNIASAPAVPLRGHQLGYRPKVNAYDAWSPEQFDQYIRELALFGVNSIEILPPRTDDKPASPHMKLPPMEMMERLSEIIDSYGLDVWVWYPNMGKDYTSAAGQQAELAERDELFRRLKRVDHVLVPGGDPGNLAPDVYFPWMEKVAVVLQRHHPKAKIWVSPQAFDPTAEWLASFYRHVNEKPAWLGGVVFGPWIATPLPEMRKIVDASIPIRNYPDITHNLDCQYPVPNWDSALALTEHRECYNPRPEAMKWIHNLFVPYTCGSLCYSEGINDDVNKFVWAAQDWDASTPAAETLRQYARLFIDPDLAGEVSEGFLSLEKDWEGPLATNQQVPETLRQWTLLEEKAMRNQTEGQYRFQMGLLRANYDAYIQKRLLRETELEREAREVLTKQAAEGTFAAMAKAETILRQAEMEPIAQDLKQKCLALSDSLFWKIGSQTSVTRHAAQNRTRGAFMDGIDLPLNDVAWISAQLRHIRELPDEASRVFALEAMLHRTDPGPGGFYDNLGAAGAPSRIVNDIPWKDDPGTLKSPRITFYYEGDRSDDREIPMAWKKQADTLYTTPLRLAYDHLDPNAEYSVKASYSGRTSHRMKLMANNQFVISDYFESHKPVEQEFPIPHAATAGGKLELEWSAGEGERSCEVAEVWLIKHPLSK